MFYPTSGALGKWARWAKGWRPGRPWIAVVGQRLPVLTGVSHRRSLDVRRLLANSFDLRFQVDHGMGDRDIGRFRADGIGLAAEFLR